MSTFVTSKRTYGQHVSPRFESRPYRQAPGRREHIYGRVQPMKPERMNRLSTVIIWGLFLTITYLNSAYGWRW